MRTSIALVASSFATASAFAPTSTQPLCVSSSALSATRRETFSTFSTATASILLSGVVQSPAQAADNEDEFNELINVLKARSDDNKEANTNYAMRADKMSSRVMKDAKTRRPKLIIVETPNGNKILTKEEFVTLNLDGKIKTTYGVRQKQGGGEMKDYNDITYTLVD